MPLPVFTLLHGLLIGLLLVLGLGLQRARAGWATVLSVVILLVVCLGLLSARRIAPLVGADPSAHRILVGLGSLTVSLLLALAALAGGLVTRIAAALPGSKDSTDSAQS